MNRQKSEKNSGREREIEREGASGRAAGTGRELERGVGSEFDLFSNVLHIRPLGPRACVCCAVKTLSFAVRFHLV